MIQMRHYNYTFTQGEWVATIYPDPKWKLGMKDKKNQLIPCKQIVEIHYRTQKVFTSSGLVAYENAVECIEHWHQTGYVPRFLTEAIGADHSITGRAAISIRNAMKAARKARLSGDVPEQPELFT